MQICSSRNHEEVVYEGRNCPACELVDEITGLKETISDNTARISELEDDLANAGT